MAVASTSTYCIAAAYGAMIRLSGPGWLVVLKGLPIAMLTWFVIMCYSTANHHHHMAC